MSELDPCPLSPPIAVLRDRTANVGGLSPELVPLSPAKGQASTRPPRWTAGKDGSAHAHTSGRTACHAPSIGERYAWPIVRRCPACLTAIAKATR
jgi:hypothetical protein